MFVTILSEIFPREFICSSCRMDGKNDKDFVVEVFGFITKFSGTRFG